MNEKRSREIWNILSFPDILTALFLIIVLIVYGRWVFTEAPNSVLAVFASSAAVLAFALVTIRFIPLWIQDWSTAARLPAKPYEGERTLGKSQIPVPLLILFSATLFRFLVFPLAYAFLIQSSGTFPGTFQSTFESIWNAEGSDSLHYLKIAESWYSDIGNDRLLIVFLPFYPILVRILFPLVHSYFTSGMLISNFCSILACAVLYELAKIDLGQYGAKRSVKFLCLFPASFLLSAPLSDSLFLLVSLLCILMLRKGFYVPAGVFGFMAAFTRMPGLLLLVPCLFELVGTCVREFRDAPSLPKYLLRIIFRALPLLLIPAGFLTYLRINSVITGNPWMFLTYQESHWHQQLGWFFSSAATEAYNLQDALISGNHRMALGLWLPNLIAVLSAPVILLFGVRKLRPSNTAYFLVYYIVCMGATWLLSAPRYCLGCYPIFLSLGAITENRWVNRAITIASALLFLLYLKAFVMQWYVY